jgi:hypothetical protein
MSNKTSKVQKPQKDTGGPALSGTPVPLDAALLHQLLIKVEVLEETVKSLKDLLSSMSVPSDSKGSRASPKVVSLKGSEVAVVTHDHDGGPIKVSAPGEGSGATLRTAIRKARKALKDASSLEATEAARKRLDDLEARRSSRTNGPVVESGEGTSKPHPPSTPPPISPKGEQKSEAKGSKGSGAKRA